MTFHTTELVATTRRVDHDVDLLALAGRDGVLIERGRAGLAGRGVAARVPLEEADALLASIEARDEVGAPGTGPVAFAALPYQAASRSAQLVIPAVIWGRSDDGTRWVTTVTAPGTPPPDVTPPPDTPLRPPSSVRAHPVRPAAWWCELVARATKAMRDAPEGGLSKVVLAREVLVEADVPFDRSVLLERLRRSYPGCFVFHVDGFLGASPELLWDPLESTCRHASLSIL